MHLTLLSFLINFTTEYHPVVARAFMVFWNRNLTGQAACARVKFEQSENFEHC